MNAAAELTASTEDVARLALRAAVEIDRFQRGKIDSLDTVAKLRDELVRSSGFQDDNGNLSFSGDVSTVNLIEAAIYNLPEASAKKIDELAMAFEEMTQSSRCYTK
jgi:hypothetical protein